MREGIHYFYIGKLMSIPLYFSAEINIQIWRPSGGRYTCYKDSGADCQSSNPSCAGISLVWLGQVTESLLCLLFSNYKIIVPTSLLVHINVSFMRMKWVNMYTVVPPSPLFGFCNFSSSSTIVQNITWKIPETNNKF